MAKTFLTIQFSNDATLPKRTNFLAWRRFSFIILLVEFDVLR